jgi:hypothetical protein
MGHLAPSATGSIKLGLLFLMLPTRVLTGQQVISSEAPAAGFAQFLCRYASRIVVLAALMFAIRSWLASLP